MKKLADCAFITLCGMLIASDDITKREKLFRSKENILHLVDGVLGKEQGQRTSENSSFYDQTL